MVSVQPNSSAHEAGIEAFLDFIIYKPVIKEGKQLLLSEYLSENIGKQIVLRVYNIIQQGIRPVTVDLQGLIGMNMSS